MCSVKCYVLGKVEKCVCSMRKRFENVTFVISDTPPPAYSPNEEKDNVTSTQADSTLVSSPVTEVCSIPYQVIKFLPFV